MSKMICAIVQKLLDDCYMLDFCNLYAKLSKRDLLDILCYVTELTRLNILCNIKYIKLTDEQRMQAAQMAQDLYNHKPWSKIVGYKDFCDLQFKVNEHVLDPRLETEEIIKLAQELVQNGDLKLDTNSNVLDLGTGSGCILIALLKNFYCKGVGVDICLNALEIAKYNAQKHKVNAQFIQSDWFTNAPVKQFDLIVSNPPYIGLGEEVGEEVKYDPKLALYGKNDGFEHYAAIISSIEPYMRQWAIFEVPVGLQQKFTHLAAQHNIYTYWHKCSADNILLAVCEKIL